MRKKLLLFIFSAFIGIIFSCNVSAKVYEITCRYTSPEGAIIEAGKYNITYSLDGNTLSIKSCMFNYQKQLGGVGMKACSKYSITNVPDNMEAKCPTSINVNNNSIELATGSNGYYDLYESSVTETGKSVCSSYKNEIDCRTASEASCVWNETEYGNYCNIDKLMYVRCGDAKDIPYQVPGLISFAVNFLKILAPIILIAMSIITLLKAVSSSNEDEMKKAQKSLIRKIIAAVLIFLVTTIVQYVMMLVSDSEIKSDENGMVETDNLSDCLNCLLNNNCGETVYYKVYVAGEYKEIPVTQIPESTYDSENSFYTDYYVGEKNNACESYGYFDNGYQPKAVTFDKTCSPIEDSGKEIIIEAKTLKNEVRYLEQTVWLAKDPNQNITYYLYWNGSSNAYRTIGIPEDKIANNDMFIITEHYKGPRASSCGNHGYFDNKYQPAAITINNTCYKLENSGNKITVNSSSQTLWKANGKCYYWKGSQNKYINVDCSAKSA